MFLTLYGQTLTLYTSPLALYAGGVVTAPIQGGWGVQDTRAAERRQAKVEAKSREDAKDRRKAVERAFDRIAPKVVAETVPEPVAREVVKIAAPALGMPIVDLMQMDAAFQRLDATIAAVWADMQAEALRRKQEEEAEIMLLMVA